MKSTWAQPSLSRDFALLSAAIFLVLFLVSIRVTYTTYARHAERINVELEKESARIERMMASEMESANYLLTALGKQIILEQDTNLLQLARTLKSFDSKGHIYSIFSWINPSQQLIVSSNKGILDTPVNISDRDYVSKAHAEPWKMAIGKPIEGRVSNHWVIPVAMGITDYTGKFVGTIMISMDIHMLTEKIRKQVQRDGITFAIISSKALIPLSQAEEDKRFVNEHFPTQTLVNVNFSQSTRGMIAKGNLFLGTGAYAYYRVSRDYPYIFLLGYDPKISDETVQGLLWSRLLQIIAMATFFLLFLWIVRYRMINPILDMTVITEAVAKGASCASLPRSGPMEIRGLAEQINRISEYIEETRRIEKELRHKMFMLKKNKEHAEAELRSKSEFLAIACQELRTPLTNITGFAQVLKDQMYGPIENRKYRQYAADIYATGNQLLHSSQELMDYALLETGYAKLPEKPLGLKTVIHKAAQLIQQKNPAAPAINILLPEKILFSANEYQLQQLLMNLLLYIDTHTGEKSTITIEGRRLYPQNEKTIFAIILSNAATLPTDKELLSAAARHDYATYVSVAANQIEKPAHDLEKMSLSISLMLASVHHAALYVLPAPEGISIAVFFDANRLCAIEDTDT